MWMKMKGRAHTKNLYNASNQTKSFIPRKHCQFRMAGLLTCNIFTALPILIMDSGHYQAKIFLCYLQLRDSP